MVNSVEASALLWKCSRVYHSGTSTKLPLGASEELSMEVSTRDSVEATSMEASVDV